ncbi:MAG: 6-phosphofructokinase [Planctomycetes bacterium]|nr:6-phosphofructokinase [Planctomycetota bacterium]
MAKRIGVMTGGGDCPGLNAVIRGVVHASKRRGWDVLGIEDATEGLVDLDFKKPHGNRWLTCQDVDRILGRGGTILGTSNRSDPFRYVVRGDDGSSREEDVSRKVVENYHKLGLDALVSIGGDGSMRIAQKFIEKGLKIVGVPKTIDQDLNGTDYTFGYHTAVQTVTDAIDRIQDTAESHDRIMVIEVMGRDAGWIALQAAIAGGAHACLIPEIPYHIDPVIDMITQRELIGHPFAVVIVAEGAKPMGGGQSFAGARQLGATQRLLGAGAKFAASIELQVSHEVRVLVLGHLQRGGSPNEFDRVLGTRYGVHAVQLIEDEKFGHMVSLRTPNMGSVPIAEAVKEPRLVDPKGQLVHAAREVGIVFGDEPRA